MSESTPSSPIELLIPPGPQYLALVRAVMTSAIQLDPRIEPHRVDDLRLAISEATTNAIEANTRADSSDQIRLTCDLAAGSIVVEIRDSGAGFDPESLVPHPPVTDPERLQFERGLGIPLMRKLMDEHEITSSDKGTTVRLVVYTVTSD